MVEGSDDLAQLVAGRPAGRRYGVARAIRSTRLAGTTS
jgi:hypothetical protein